MATSVRQFDRLHQLSRRQPWLGLFLKFITHMRIDSKEVAAIDDRGSALDLWAPQRRFLEELVEGLIADQRMVYCLKGRQQGISTLTLAILLFWVAARPRTIAALVTPDDNVRDAFRDTLERYVKSFPPKFFGERFVKVKHNDAFFLFSNGSRIDYLVAGKRRKNWGESRGYSACLCTEVAKYGTVEGIRSFIEALAQAHPDRLFMFESTAEGFNQWREMWYDAEDEPTINRIFIGWWAKELNHIRKSSPLFQKYSHPPSGEEHELCNEVLEHFGHVVTMEQLAWYRWKLANSDQQSMDQNNPWCVTAETRVGTVRGVLKIIDVRVGDKTSRGTVVAAGPTGSAPIWRATTRLGYEFRGTANHPIIDIEAREIRLDRAHGITAQLCPPQLQSAGIYLHCWRNGVIDHRIEITPDFARLVGLYMGDGSLSGNNHRSGYELCIACAGQDADVVAEVHRLIRSLFGVNTQESEKGKDETRGRNGCIRVRTNSRIIFNTFMELGLAVRNDYNGGIKRHVHVPEFIWRSPKHVVKEFLSGLFEADGFNGYKENRVVLATKYEEFAKDVQLLLLAFGVTCKRVATYATLGEVKWRTNTLNFRSIEAWRFNEEIGFLSARKRERGHWVSDVPRWKDRFEKMLDAGVPLQDEVVDVVCDGHSETVYNVTVEPGHLFDANGILTHNTPRQAFVMSGYSFFPMRMLQNRYEQIYEQNIPFKAYRFIMGNTFWSMKLDPILEPERYDEIELKIWEEPIREAQYVIGADPAYGSSEDSHYHGISVWRCYADKLVQVAEYADKHYMTKHCAWVLAGLAGVYRDCMVNLELYGPGRIVMNEFDNIRNQLRQEIYNPLNEANRWDEDFMAYARWFMYRRVDQPGPGFVYNFECLALETRLPTPNGWTTMGELREGDFLLSETGKPTKVLGLSTIKFNANCYEITFDDGTVIVADQNHLWKVARVHWKDKHDRLRKTSQLMAGKHYIRLPEALDLPERELPLDPYLLGAWLGDGCSTAAVLFCGDEDVEEMAANVEACGQPTKRTRVKTCWNLRLTGGNEIRTRGAFLGVLRELGVLNNKHIPEIYLRASLRQRLNLLQGLMDTDGGAGGNGGPQCEFVTSNKAIADGFAELVRTLGFKAKFLTCDQSVMYKGECVACPPRYQFWFTAYPEMPVFRLQRKARRLSEGGRKGYRKPCHRIVSIKAIATVPVRCVMVDSPTHLFLAGDGMIPTHNTSARRKWELFNMFRDHVTSELLVMNSVKLIEEMALYQQERNEIAPYCPDTKDGHGDRAFAAALATWAWDKWARPALIAAGATYERVQAEAAGTSTIASRMMDRLVYSYFARKEEEAEEMEDTGAWASDSWRQERGLL